MNWLSSEALGLVGLIVAVLALVVGAIHVLEIRGARRALSTKYLGKFPYFLPDIVKLLEGVRYKAVIFCDFPAYGDLTDRVNGLKYKYQLESLCQQDKLELICLDDSSRAAFVREQFSSGAWLENPHKKEQIVAYLKDNSTLEDPTNVNEEEIIKVMNDVDSAMLKKLRGVAIEIPGRTPIYFWIADEKKAVFSIPALSLDAVEYGFETSDHALIQALMDMTPRFRAVTNKLDQASTESTENKPPPVTV
jgi:hypothetical protein